MGGSVFDIPADEGGKSSAGNSSHPHTELVTFFPPWPQGVVCRSVVLRPGIEPVPPAVEARSLHQWTRISSRESCFTCRRIKCAPRAELAHPDSTALGGTLVHLEAGCWVRSCRGGWEGWEAVWPWLLPGSGRRRWRWETGRGPDDRSEPAPGPRQHPGEGENTVPCGGQLEAGPVVGRAGLREARGCWAGRQGGGQGWEYLRM